MEDCRRAVFLCLAGIDERKRARLAGVIAAGLRDAGLLGGSVEQHYSAAQVAALCGGRSSAWAVRHARAGDFGPVICDGGDWLIPASGVNDYLARYAVGVATFGKKDGAESVSGSEKENANAPGMNGSAGGVAAGRADVRSGGRISQVIDGQITVSEVVAGDAAGPRPEARIRRGSGGGSAGDGTPEMTMDLGTGGITANGFHR